MDSKHNTAKELSNAIPLTRASGLVMILNTPKGRGVFASQDIPRNTILDVCPVLVLSPRENDEHVRKTTLYHYTYNWPYHPTDGQSTKSVITQAVILGIGSLFNHSTYSQNVGWIRDIEHKLVTYSTVRDIQRGEELCISYGERLTFVDTDARVMRDRVEDAEEDMLARISLV